jgi:hypothetical protein
MWKIAGFVTVFAPAYAASRARPRSIMTTAMITVTTIYMQPIPMPIIRMGLKAHVKYLRANFI